MNMFTESNGKVSSTRVSMFICVIMACLLALILILTNIKKNVDPGPWNGLIITFLSAGFGVKFLHGLTGIGATLANKERSNETRVFPSGSA